MAPTGFKVYVEDKCITVEGIDLDLYFTKDLYADVIALAHEQNVCLPSYIGFKYHPPFEEVMCESLSTDADWNKMVGYWGDIPTSHIPLFVINLQDASALQVMAERIEPNVQTSIDLNLTDVEQWADDLLVSPFEETHTPKCGSKSTSSNKLPIKRSLSMTHKILPSFQCSSFETPVYATSTEAFQATTNALSTPLEEGETSKKSEKQRRTKKGKGTQEYDTTGVIIKLCNKELKGLEAYDIPTLSNPHLPMLDVFFEGLVIPKVGETIEGEDDVGSDASLEGSDYVGEDVEGISSEDVSMDDESDVTEDMDIDKDTVSRQVLGNEEEHGEDSGSLTIVNKMAKVFRTGRLWSRSRDGKVELNVGDIFISKADFLRVMKDYIIQRGITLKKVKNDKRRYTHVCKNEKCSFRIHASRLIDGHSWMIKTLSEGHVCSVKEHNKRAGASWVASHLLEDYRANKGMSVETVQKLVLSRNWTAFIPRYTCWRALRLMRAMVDGKHEDGYKLLPQYMDVFKERNPDSHCFIKWQEQGPGRNPIFKRCLICVGSAVSAFKKFCRPLIGIDACHLKGPYEGVLLTAMALDGNNGQFPLAYGVADCEDEIEWCFFLHGLSIALECSYDSSTYTIISDRHKAIIKGLQTVFPKSPRRICVLHFYKNYASKFSGAWFHSMFYICANTYSEYVFTRAMETIKEENEEAYTWLKSNEPHDHWARHKFDPKIKSDDNTNNFVESFNKAIISHRGKPVLTMLEEIRKLVGNRFDKRFGMGRTWSNKVTPYVDKKLRALEEESRVCSQVIAAGKGEFDVMDGSTNFTVRLREQSCDCNKWQVTGLPCKHAARCILRLNEKLEDYCSHWFSVENYKGLYDGIIHPIPDPCMWGKSSTPTLDPPRVHKKMGRPKKHKRREGLDDIKIKKKGFAHGTKRCSKCKQLGHNHRTCGQMRDVDGSLLKKHTRKKKVPEKRNTISDCVA